jgi:hypothetical protein
MIYCQPYVGNKNATAPPTSVSDPDRIGSGSDWIRIGLDPDRIGSGSDWIRIRIGSGFNQVRGSRRAKMTTKIEKIKKFNVSWYGGLGIGKL